jgi:hypothetical protein
LGEGIYKINVRGLIGISIRIISNFIADLQNVRKMSRCFSPASGGGKTKPIPYVR